MSVKHLKKLCAIFLIWFGLFACTGFPKAVGTEPYSAEVAQDGEVKRFHSGVLYRYPGILPMLEVSGSHYEMGLQYGVLLREEILSSLDSYVKILRWNAENFGVPHRMLLSAFRRRAKKMSVMLPERFFLFLSYAHGFGDCRVSRRGR